MIGQVNSATPLSPHDLVGIATAEFSEDWFYLKNPSVLLKWRDWAKAHFLNCQKAFSRNKFKVGCEKKNAQHYIRLFKCFWEWSQRIPLVDLNDLKEQIAEMKRKGLIRECRSTYAFPIAVVRKKNGVFRNVYWLSWIHNVYLGLSGSAC